MSLARRVKRETKPLAKIIRAFVPFNLRCTHKHGHGVITVLSVASRLVLRGFDANGNENGEGKGVSREGGRRINDISELVIDAISSFVFIESSRATKESTILFV